MVGSTTLDGLATGRRNSAQHSRGHARSHLVGTFTGMLFDVGAALLIHWLSGGGGWPSVSFLLFTISVDWSWVGGCVLA